MNIEKREKQSLLSSESTEDGGLAGYMHATLTKD